MLQLQVIDGDKLKWATFFFTFHVFIFIPFIRKVVFCCITLCQVKSEVFHNQHKEVVSYVY